MNIGSNIGCNGRQFVPRWKDLFEAFVPTDIFFPSHVPLCQIFPIDRHYDYTSSIKSIYTNTANMRGIY